MRDGTRPADYELVDAGDRRCGEAILFLKQALDRLSAGQIVGFVCDDPAAPEDVPAWCRMTGHRLVWTEERTFFIKRREA